MTPRSIHDVLRFLPLVLASLVPFVLGAGALFTSRRSPFAAATFATFASAGLATVAVGVRALAWWAADDGVAPTPGSWIQGLVQLDLVSSAMLVLVCALALVVVRYSRTYLVGERGLARFAGSLLLTVGSVSILVISNHLALLMAGWFAASVFLHRLLTFYRTRRQAIIVAHKKFLLSRIADMCFISSLGLLLAEFGSLRIDVINSAGQAVGAFSVPLHVATVLLVFGVLLKSAQLPFHGWMQQVMEAPTPVSALLHAGVVNVGGFVMIRLAPLMANASIAQGLLLGVGLVTSIIASLVMTMRVSYKVVLAWSTIAQMGFMLVQCGLGAWHLALMHLLAHSVYKAHTFLSAGSVVQTWRGTSLVQPARPTLGLVAIATVVATVGVVPFYAVVAVTSTHPSTSLGPLALVLGLSFAPMIARALAAGGRAFALAALLTVGAAASYFGWHLLFEELAPSINGGASPSSLKWSIVVAGLGLLFLAQTALQTSPNGRFAHWLQPHLLSGLYIDDWFTRVTFRLWPPRLERPPVGTRVSVTSEVRSW